MAPASALCGVAVGSVLVDMLDDPLDDVLDDMLDDPLDDVLDDVLDDPAVSWPEVWTVTRMYVRITRMRWEELRTDVEDGALLAAQDVAPAAASGTGRAGVHAPGPGPIESGNSEEAVAVEIRARSIINRVPGESRVPFRWTINPYRGCSHACKYCFARRTHEYLDLDSGNDFDSTIMVKVNAGQLIRQELGSSRWHGDPIAMGTNTDPYQRAEGRYGLMREIIAALRDFANPFSILTKGSLISRDIDLLAQAARVTEVNLAFSVGFVDEQLWRSVEPGTPSPRRRLDVLRRLTDLGIGGSVLMAPILPGLTDTPEQIERTVEAIAQTGARSVTPLTLHLRPGAREWYLGWLAEQHPHLVPTYQRLYRHGSYAPKSYQEEVAARVRHAAERHGLNKDAAGPARSGNAPSRVGAAPAQSPAARRPRQLSLL